MIEHPPNTQASIDSHPEGHFAAIADGDAAWVCDTSAPREQLRGTLVFLHSAVGNQGTFTHQVSWFAEHGFRTLAYDRRGHGRTPPGQQGSSKATATDDLLALLDGKQITAPVHVVGAAAGGRLAVDFAFEHPERVTTLTLVCSMAGIAAEIYPEGTSALLPPEFLALTPYLRELGPVYRGDNPQGTEAWRELVERSVPEDIVSDPALWVAKPKPTASAGHQNTPGPRGVQGLAWLMEPGGATPHGIPIHLITGDADPYTTPSAYTRLSRSLPGSALDVITGSGHSPYWEQPGIFNAKVLHHVSAAATQGAIA
ncbi:MAG: alpha/beta hydrolase [Arthrobacter sp.]|nr:alpha/beta hydrolase [Arthrobacter sp.]